MKNQIWRKRLLIVSPCLLLVLASCVQPNRRLYPSEKQSQSLLSTGSGGPILDVSPVEPFELNGLEGEALDPSEKIYTINNTGNQPFPFQVDVDQAWLSVDPSSGTLQPGQSLPVSVRATAGALPAGNYTGQVSFLNLVNGDGNEDIRARLILRSGASAIRLTPATGFTHSTRPTGPFDATQTFEIENLTGDPIDVQIESAASFVRLIGQTRLNMDNGESAQFGVGIQSQAAMQLGPGSHSSQVVVTIRDPNNGNIILERHTRPFSLTLNNTNANGVVPIYRTPNVNHGGLFTIEFANHESTAFNSITRFAHIFKQGDFGRNTQVIALDRQGVPVPLQTHIRATYPDGSVKHAVFFIELNIPARGQQVIEIKRGANSLSGSAITIGNLRNRSNYQHEFTITHQDGVSSMQTDRIRLREKIGNSGIREVLFAGPLATVWRLKDNLTRHLSYTAYITATRDGGAYTELVMENVKTFVPSTDVPYRLRFEDRNNVVFFEADINHRYWTTTMLESHRAFIQPKVDYQYMMQTPMMTDQDLTQNGVAQTAIDRHRSALLNGKNLPMGRGSLEPFMPAGGVRPSIGPIPGWDMHALMVQSADMYRVLFVNANVMGHVSWCNIDDRQNSAGQGLPLQHFNFPKIGAGTTGLNQYLDRLGIRPEGPRTSEFTPDTAHQPNGSYVAYLLTGHEHYLNLMLFRASYSMVASWNDFYRPNRLFHDRGGSNNNIQLPLQTREVAWTMRTLAFLKYILPDGHPMIRHTAHHLDANLQRMRDLYLSPTTNPEIGVNYDQKAQFSGIFLALVADQANVPNRQRGSVDVILPFQQNYMTMMLDILAMQGNGIALQLLDYAAQKTNWILNGFGTPYYIAMRDRGSSSIYQPQTAQTFYDQTFCLSGSTAGPCVFPGRGGILGGVGEVDSFEFLEMTYSQILLKHAPRWREEALEGFGLALGGVTEKIYASTFYNKRRQTRINYDHSFNLNGVRIPFIQWVLGDENQNSQLTGDANANLMHGMAGDDVLLGGGGNDVIYGGLGDDQINGQNGNDYLLGLQGDDFLAGEAGDDVLIGGKGNDTYLGGDGADTFRFCHKGEIRMDETRNGTGGLQPLFTETVMDFNPGQGDRLAVDLTRENAALLVQNAQRVGNDLHIELRRSCFVKVILKNRTSVQTSHFVGI